ncbi:MAG: glycosyltransferase family 2 protein [Rhodobacteraceae bacterium]|nr:glycosyltransferase family 2 protein [Paracoccaceae bacterium]
MDLSIVIVNWNTQDLLRDCLQTVEAGLGGLRAEVLVVDNASDDGSVEMVQHHFPKVRLIENKENVGFAGGNNIALAEAIGRHVLLLNTDTLVHGSVLPEAVAWLDDNPQVGVLGPRVLNTDGSIQPSCSAFPSLTNLLLQTLGLTRVAKLDRFRMTGWDHASERRVEVISGAAMFVRTAAMRDVGMLDEAFFFYGEETDWCCRFAKAGWEIAFAPIRDITHFGSGSVVALNHRRDVMLTEATIRLHRKHGGFLSAFVCFLILSAHNISRAVFWSLASLVNRPGARLRATHFTRVVRDLPRTWPKPLRHA